MPIEHIDVRNELVETLDKLEQMFEAQVSRLERDGMDWRRACDMNSRPLVADLLVAIANLKIALAGLPVPICSATRPTMAKCQLPAGHDGQHVDGGFTWPDRY